MEKKEYEERKKDFEYAISHLYDASNNLFEGDYFLRQTKDDSAKLLA